jgi:hypothetical protein
LFIFCFVLFVFVLFAFVCFCLILFQPPFVWGFFCLRKMPSKQLNRSAQVEKHFDGGEMLADKLVFTCSVLGCTEKVQCVNGRGAPGRLSHLKTTHRELYDALPPARSYSKKIGGAKIAEPNAQAPNEEQQTPQTQPPKRPREEEAIDFFGRSLLPFSLVEDSYFKETGLTRKTLPEKMAKRLTTVRAQFVATNEGQFCSISIDSGTNAGERTLDVNCRHRCVSRFVQALRIQEQTGENVKHAVEGTIRAVLPKLVVAAFVSDNAANMRCATRLLAAAFHCLHNCCANHALNTMAKRIAYTWQCVADSRSAADKARESGMTIPAEIDSRWIGCYNAIDRTHQARHTLVVTNVITRAESEALEQAKPLLDKLYFSSRALERDASTIFDTVATIPSSLVDVCNDALFPELFSRNLYCPALVAAAALSPNFAPEALIPPTKKMIAHCIRECFYDLSNDFNERQMDAELKLLFDGSLQRLFRLKNTEGRFPARKLWTAGDTPLLGMLFDYLEHTPSSSSDVERTFSAHARTHTWLRNGLAAESLDAQLGLHSFLAKAAAIGTQPVAVLPAQCDIEMILDWCLQTWSAERANQISEQDQLLVWFATGNSQRLVGYRGRVTSVEGNCTFKMKWNNDPTNMQRLNAKVDPWLFVSDA